MKLDTPARAAAFMARTSFRACASFALIHLLANPAAAQSIAGASVSAGTATVSGIGSTNVVVTQTSDKAVVDWRAFSVDAGTSVTFRQPGAASIALNRITGSGTTRIDGSLVANGQVWLLNPNGVLIGAGGSVAAGGFLASTHAMSNADFMAGHYQLTSDGTGTAGVVNLGSIVAAEGGYAVLAGNQVGNAGLVQARLGTVALGAGKTMVLDVVGDKLLSFAVTEPLRVVASNGALVDNRGVLAAQGGQVLLTARAAAGVVGSVINTSGLIDATAVSTQGGTIVLDGGTAGEVDATGVLSVSGLGAGQTGGTIQAFGQTVVAGDYAALDARGSVGGGSIYLGGGWQGASIGGHASAVRAGVASTAVLDASAIDSGNGGTVELWSDVTNPYSQTLAYGGFYARGGAKGGDGGRIETSGHYLDTTGATGSAATVLGKAGTWLFDPYNVEIVAAGSGGSSPAIVNPGFENGLSGWITIGSGGSADVVTSAQGSDGTNFTSPVSAGGHFLLATGGTQDSNNGVYQTFTGVAGQSFNLYALFLGKDDAYYNDDGVVTLTRPDNSVQTLYSQNLSMTGGPGNVPWQNQIVTLAQTGNYTITATSANHGDGAAPSQLGFELATGGTTSSNGAFAANGGFQTWTPTATGSKIDVSQITGFLNAGTNVQLTTTGAGNEAGNITVNAAIAKTAGAAATLQLDALGGIVVNQAIGSTSGALNVTLNAGAGGIALNNGVGTNGGTLALNTTGPTTQSAAFSTGTLTLNGAGGAYALTNPANSFATLGGSTGSIAITNAAAATTLTGLTTSDTLSLTTSGTVTQNAALSAATLSLNGVGGAYTLTNAANSVATLTGGTGSIALTDAVALSLTGLTTSGALTVTDTGSLNVTAAVSVGAASQLSASQAITIGSGGHIATSAGTLALVAGTNFVNQAGANAIATTGTGRWLIYSQAPATDTFGGLLSNNTAVWGATLASTPPGSAPSGNRYLFALSPTITVMPTATHKTYGDTLTAAGVAYTTSGLISAATYGNVFTQDVLTGAPGVDGSYGGFAPTSYTGAYQLHSTQGSLATTTGYTFAFGQSTLTVDPRALILAALTDSRVYDRTTTSSLTPTASGLVNGDTISNLSQAFDSANAGGRLLSATNSYVITTTGGQTGSFNYTITKQTAAGTITPKALTAALTGSTTKIYDGTTTAALPASDYQLSGVIMGDTVALNNPASGAYADKNVGTGKTVTVTGLALTGTSASNYTVNASASAAIGSITAKTLAASLIGSVAKTYDGGTAATLAGGNYALAGTVSGDAVALNSPTAGTYDTKNVGSGKVVSVSGLALTGADAGNYTVNTSASAAIGSITAKALAASLMGSVAKTYDGTTGATLANSNYALAGTVMGDSVALNNPTAGTYDTKNVGSAKAVSVSGLTLMGADAGNYTVNASASAAIGSITAKTLAASLIGSVAKTYDGGIAATLAGGNYALAGTVMGDAVALNNPTAGTYDTKNVGSGKAVSVSGLALTGADAGNYAVNTTATAAIGSITAKTVAATLIGSVAKTYDGGTAATLAGGNYALAGTVMGDAVALNNPIAGTYDTKNVGSGKAVSVSGLALTGADAGNYAVNATATAAIGSITAKTVAATLIGSVAKTYDGGTAATLTGGNYALAGTVSGDAVALNNPTAGTYDTKNVGSGKIVSVGGLALTGADAGNYAVNATATAAIGSITAKTVAATLIGSVAKTYDGGTAATLAGGNYALAGTVMGDAVALNNPIAGAYDTKNVGSGKAVSVSGLALTGADAGNYAVNSSASAAIGSITPKTLAASLAGSVDKTYDGSTAATLADGNYVLTGAVSGDAVALNDPTVGAYDTKSAATGKTVSVTGLALTGADAGNYTVNAGTSATIGSVAAKALAASLTGSVAKTYDGTTAATLAGGNYVLTGAVSGDTVALNDPTTGTYDTRNAGSGKTVAVTGFALTGVDAGNYTVNAGTSAAIGSIAAKTLAATLTGSISKTYDGNTVATLADGNYVLTGAVSGDAVALNDPVTGTYDTKNAGAGKTVSVAGLGLTGADAGNYTVNTDANATIGSIAPKALSASLTGTVSKTYDGSAAATLTDGNYVLTGAVSGDAVALNDPVAGTYDTRNVGSGKTVAVNGLTLTGGDAGNYTVNAGASTAIGSIAAKALAATLTGNVAKTYDGTTAATLSNGNYVLTGAVAGDAVTLNDPTVGTYDTKNAGTGKAVSVTGLALNGADAGNYIVNAGTSAAIGSIAAKALAASLTGNVAKTYDGTTAATLATGNYVLSGAISGDAVALNDPVAGAYDTKNAGTAKTVAVSGLALTGADAVNYTVNAATSAAVGVVTAKALAASLTGSVAKTYDGTTAATLANSNYMLAGAVSGDAVALNNPVAGTYDTKNAGSGKTVAVSGLGLTGADAGNYTVNTGTSAAIGSIATKTLAASLTGNVSKTYDGTNTATLANGNYVLSGAVTGDAVALNDAVMGTYDTKNAGSGKTVAVSGLGLTGADAGNYTVNTGTSAPIGSIATKTLAASLTGSVSKTYDGTTAAALANGNYVLSGAVTGDAVALNDPVAGTYDTKNAGSGKTVAVSGLGLTGADAGNYTVNTGTNAAIGSIATKTLAASLTGSVSKTYDGTTAATLANGNYVLTGVVSGDAVALNSPVAGAYDTKNVGTAKSVAVTGIALTGADAGNYTVNADTRAAVGTVVARALTVALVGTVAKTANGGTDATLAADNFLLAGFVSGEGATVGKTNGDYANASAGTGIVVTTTLAASDFAPNGATALSNYVLPLGKVSAPIGTINPSIVIVTPQPVTPPAAVVAAIAATAVLPATSVPVPVTPAADAPSAAAVSVAAVAGTVAISVDRSPPSPVAAQKPPTPVDTADAGDPILASVSEPPSEKPASHATRQTSVTVPIAGGLLGQQQALPSRSGSVPGVDQAFSGGGGSF